MRCNITVILELASVGFYFGGLSLLACHCLKDTANRQASIAQLLSNVARSEYERILLLSTCPISAGAAKLRMQFGSRRYVGLRTRGIPLERNRY